MDQSRFCQTCYFCIKTSQAFFCGEGPPRLVMTKTKLGTPAMTAHYPPVDPHMIACGKYRPDIETARN